MVYKLVTATSPMVMWLFVGIIFLIINNGGSIVVAILSIFTIIFSIISFGTKTEFIISQKELTYVIRIYSYKAFHKKLSSADINKILFKRFGWTTKGAVLKLHKGINLRIVQFIPKDVMLQLEIFAIDNNVLLANQRTICYWNEERKY